MATTKRSNTRATSSKTRSTSSKSRSTGAKADTKTSTRSAAHKGGSATTARKTGSKTANGQAWTDKKSDNSSSTGHGKAKKEPAKQTSHCWPGYEPVAGKPAGAKGSCKPKAKQTAAEKKSDGMAAAASKLRKSGK